MLVQLFTLAFVVSALMGSRGCIIGSLVGLAGAVFVSC